MQTHNDERLLAAWQQYSTNAGSDGQFEFVRPVALQAWRRCRELGIDPQNLCHQFLSDEELVARRRENRDLLDASRPYMEYLSRILSGKPHVVALSDHEGWILDIIGDPLAFGGRATGIWQGASWSESTIGNNGIGTALATQFPVLVFGIEHYAEAFHPASCLGVPIHWEQEVIGALDVSVLNPDADPERLTLAQACVQSIETLLAHMRSASQTRSEEERHNPSGEQLSTIIHDVKQPLTAMRVTTELGARDSSGEKGPNYFAMLLRQIDRLSETLDSIADGSDPDGLSIESVSKLVEDVVEDIRPSCDVAGVALNLTLQSDSQVRVHPGSFSRALLNLITNAIEAMPSGGLLCITVKSDESAALICVEDSGPGIPQDLHSRVFQPFVSGRAGGSGLGLYSVYRTITRTFGGRIWFDSNEGSGTKFFVELPVAEDIGESVPGQRQHDNDEQNAEVD